ncbi:hypothetical protein EKI60_02410 [Candidatus Saccharibacteria bacterium]|nr:MAG: hypothetical protein EKI60_02410 [Candidatus Saccharibacteria bacterium]
MTIHQKFTSYALLSVIGTFGASYAVMSQKITGVLLVICFALAVLLAILTVALFIASITKDPPKTFSRWLDWLLILIP